MVDPKHQPRPLVSVIMPCFNAGPMLRPALDSVIRQTWPNLEIIFVDNNSTDASLALAKEIAATGERPMRVVQCLEQGVNHARNLGFTLARGEFIQWMDADDELAPDKVARQVAAMLEEPSIDIAYGDWLEVRVTPGRADRSRAHVLKQVDDQISRTLATVWYPPHLYLLRRDAAERLQVAQAWRADRPVATDVEYSAVAALLGLSFRHIPGARVRYNVWSDSQMGSRIGYRARATELAAIFQQLKGLVAEQGVRLSPNQAMFLNQGWDLWRMAPGSVEVSKLGARRFTLRRTDGGRPVETRSREAAAAPALMAASDFFTSCHLALVLTDTVRELGGDHAAAMQALQRLQQCGLMDRIEAPALKTPAGDEA